MSRVRLVDAAYDPQTGISTVTKTSPYGLITTQAQLSDEDKEKNLGSRWDGCFIAEKRADIEIQRKRTQRLKKRAHAEKAFIKRIQKELALCPQKIDNLSLLDFMTNIADRDLRQANTNQVKLQYMEETLPNMIDQMYQTRKSLHQKIQEKE